MTREEEIRARLEKATPGPWKYNDHDARMGAIVTDDKINDDVVWADGDPYACVRISEEDAALIANAPSDIDYLLKQNQRMAEALKRIIHRSSLAQKQLDRREEPSNIPWDVSYFRGKTTAWNDAETIARQALEGRTDAVQNHGGLCLCKNSI